VPSGSSRGGAEAALIGGEWVDAGEGATLRVEDPRPREIAEVADATPDDALAPLRRPPPNRRSGPRTAPGAGEILPAYEVMIERADELALV